MNLTGVWTDLIGQARAVDQLQRAVAGSSHAMTHAWLFTGPPGSGRSNAARAFAAALQCEQGGCGECRQCRTSLSGAHPDVTLVRTEQLSIGVDEVRDLARRAASSPMLKRWQIIVIEDADRVTERGADALLKSIEEPAPKTVWLLCAPTAEDVVITIRSRCRQVWLSTPSDQAVAELLVRRDGISPELAEHAARVAQGHIGRARAIAMNEAARTWREEILGIPSRLRSVSECLAIADDLVKKSSAEAQAITVELDAREKAELSASLGLGTKGAKPRNSQAMVRDLEEQQKSRAKRIQRDALDRALTELTTYYRDILGIQTGGLSPINAEIADQLAAKARKSTPELTLRRIDAILEARGALARNVTPLLAVEALMLALGGE